MYAGRVAIAAFMLACAAPALASDADEVRRLELRWGEAFLKGDHAFLRSILAPEFKLMRAEGGKTLFTPRTRWFDTLGRYTFHTFQVQVTDVVIAGRTAVREEPFILSDTWVKRNGRWQVVYRHSTPGPAR